MQIDKIINNIEDSIQVGLRHRYNNHVELPLSEFVTTPEIKNNTVSNSSGTVNITIPENDNYFLINSVKYRLPQTRLFYSHYVFNLFEVNVIDYFTDTIVFIKTYESDRKMDITVNAKTRHALFSSPPLNPDNELKNVKIKDSFISWFNEEKRESGLNQAGDFLHDKWQEELKVNPVYQIHSQDINFLLAIDQLWAKLPHIGPGRYLKIDKISNTGNNVSYFFWIQELYMYFGWSDELSAAGKTIKEQEKRDKKKGKYLEHLSSVTEAYRKLDEQLQQDWEYYQYAVLKFHLKKLVHDNPDEFIAMGLLAYRRQFAWANQLKERIAPLLPFDLILLFDLLTRLNQALAYSTRKNSACIANNSLQAGMLSFTRKQNQEYKFYSRGNKRYSLLSLENLSFKIDKQVIFFIDITGKTITIHPHIHRPPLQLPQTKNITLAIGGDSFNIPLIWSQFTVELNGTRIRFLFKKNRFQLSIKKRTPTEKIIIEKSEIPNNNQRYSKFYIPIVKGKSSINIELLDLNNVRLRSCGPHIGKIIFRGSGLDRNGLLSEQFRLSAAETKKTLNLSTNNFQSDPIPVSAGKELYKFSFFTKQSDPLHISIKNSTGVLWKIITSDPGRLNIFLSSQKSNLENIVREQCIKKLSFVPRISMLHQLRERPECLPLIIGDDAEFKILEEYRNFKIIDPDMGHNRKALLINEDSINFLFSREFFADFQLNIFDFKF